MHQPLIPAGGADLRTARDHQQPAAHDGAPGHRRQPQRAGVPLVLQAHGRVHSAADRRGQGAAGHAGVLGHAAPRPARDGRSTTCSTRCGRITCNPDYRRAVEWLGAPWGHAVAPSTPVQDYRLHVRAWQHHFAAIFGTRGACARARLLALGDGAAQPSRTSPTSSSRRCGTAATSGCWCRSTPSSSPATARARSASTCRTGWCAAIRAGEAVASIIAIIKTQGSDTKLVAQMQPYYEAKGLHAGSWPASAVPPLVTPDRRRRERRRDDERVPVQVHGGRARGERLGDAAAERHRVPRAPRQPSASARMPPRRAAALPEAHLGPLRSRAQGPEKLAAGASRS